MKVKKYKNINEIVYSTTLPNKMKVYFIKKIGFLKKGAIIATPFGSIDSCRKINIDGRKIKLKDGIAHFLEHRMFTINNEDASDLFAQNGANSNAFTSHTQTAYHFECSQKFYENLAILLKMIDSFDSTTNQIENEKSIIIQELRMYKDEDYVVLIDNLYKQAYKNHPLCKDIGGTEESVAETNYDLLKAAFETFYDPSNLTLVITGDLDENELEKFLINHQLKVKKPIKIPKIKFFNKDQVFSESSILYRNVSIPILGVLIKLPNEKMLKSRKGFFVILMILEHLFSLSSTFTERLFEENKITETIAYEVSVNVDLPRIMLYNENVNYEIIIKEIDNLFNHDFKMSKQDFARIKNSFCGKIIRSYDDNFDTAIKFLNLKMNGEDLFLDTEIIKSIKYEEIFKIFNIISQSPRTTCIIRRKEK